MVLVRREVVDPATLPYADLPFGLRIRARAETVDGDRIDGRLISATVRVARGHENDEKVLAHELLVHVIKDKTNAGHHPWTHCCIQVGHAVRRWKHDEGVLDLARRFARTGIIETSRMEPA